MGINAIIYNEFIIFHAAPKSPVAAPPAKPAEILAFEEPDVVSPKAAAIAFTAADSSSSSSGCSTS